jgi:hypothetical protein
MSVYLENQTEYLRVLESDREVLNKAPVVEGSTLVLMDMQVPYQDGEFVLQMLQLAKKWKVRKGISGGDFFNQAAFSQFLNDPREAQWLPEAEKAKGIAEVMLRFVPEWVFLMGNHDAFLLKRVAHQLGHRELLRLADMPRACEGTDYYWCLVRDKLGNEWRVSHPRNISVIAGRVPQTLANKFHQNIIAGHGHLAGLMPNISGDYLCIDCGICCDPQRLDYYAQRDSTRPAMNQGAVILREVDGRIYPYHIMPQWADWGALRRLY